MILPLDVLPDLANACVCVHVLPRACVFMLMSACVYHTEEKVSGKTADFISAKRARLGHIMLENVQLNALIQCCQICLIMLRLMLQMAQSCFLMLHSVNATSTLTLSQTA